MRLYLSSFRVGEHPDRLLQLSSGRRVALVPNAIDGSPAEMREASLRRDFADLRPLGLEVSETDLRDPDAPRQLGDADIVWVRGGNVFRLRRALADTGADQVLIDLIKSDAIVYGGYSAGCCVLAPDLIGLERVDDITAVADPVMTGLGVIDRPFVPHVQSPAHPETSACDDLAAWYAIAGRPHWALRDGEVLVVDGDVTELLSGDHEG